MADQDQDQDNDHNHSKSAKKAPPQIDMQKFLNSILQVGNVHFTGLERTKKDFVQEIIQPYIQGTSLREILNNLHEAVNRLNRTGAFKGVSVDLEDSDKLSTTDVTFSFTEHSLYSMEVGTEFNESFNDNAVTGKLHMRNIGGRGESLGADFSYGSSLVTNHPSNSATLEFRKPYIRKKDLDLRVIANYMSRFELESSYWSTQRSSEYIFETPYGHFSYDALWRTLQVGDNTSMSVRTQAGDSFKSALSFNGGLDTRDNIILPTNGYAADWAIELAGLFGDAYHAKAQASVQGHVPGNYGSALSWMIKAGIIQPLGNRPINIHDKFFLGQDSFRGFKKRGVGPHDGNDALGGEAFYSAVASYSKSMPAKSLIGKYFSSRMHGFIAAGNNLSLEDTKSAFNGGFLKMVGSTRVSVGLGIALESPFGRLEINWNHIVRSQKYDKCVDGLQFVVFSEFC